MVIIATLVLISYPAYVYQLVQMNKAIEAAAVKPVVKKGWMFWK